MHTLTPARRARLALMRAIDPPAPVIHALVLEHGPERAIEMIRANAAPGDVTDEIKRPLDYDLTPDIAAIQSGCARFVTPDDDEWPPQLNVPAATDGFTPPLGLWLRGTPRLNKIGATLHVGGEEYPHDDAQRLATAFVHYHSARGTTIVTPLQLGISQVAIDAALNRNLAPAPGPIVILASGFDDPRGGGEEITARVLDQGGLLLTEQPPTTSIPDLYSLYRPLAIAAALANATVLIAASSDDPSGFAIATAKQLGRPNYGAPERNTLHLIDDDGTNPLAKHFNEVLMAMSPDQHIREPEDLPGDAVTGRLAASRTTKEG